MLLRDMLPDDPSRSPARVCVRVYNTS